MTAPLARKPSPTAASGIGCDQLILLEPSTVADLKMRIWNHDGGEVAELRQCLALRRRADRREDASRPAAACVDGRRPRTATSKSRSASRDFAWDEVPLTYAMDTSAMPMALGTARASDGAQCRQPAPRLLRRRRRCDRPRRASGPSIEHDPAFPERINVNVAAVAADGIQLRTWERGAGLTLACGTGACATAVAAIASKRVQSPVKVTMPRRLADHRLGAGRADPDARRRRPMSSRARSTWRRFA